MLNTSEIISDYVALHHSGDSDAAFHGLLDHGVQLIPGLIEAYESSESTDARAFLLQVVASFRSSESGHFLRHALRRSEPEIWKLALDGLVLIRGTEHLEHVLDATHDEPKRSWILEAISQSRDPSFHQSP